MTTKVQKWGNSQGLRLPKKVLHEAGISVGDEVELSVEKGSIRIAPVTRIRGRYRLSELVAEISEDYTPGEVDWGPATGQEVW